MKRLLIATVDFPPARGGIQTMAREIVRRIDDFEVRLIAPDADGAAAVDAELGGRVRRVRAWPGGKQGTYAAVNAAAWRQARSWKPDVALALHVLAAPGLIASRVPTAVATYAVELLSPRIRPIAKAVLGRTAHVVAVSRFTAEASVSLGADRSSLSVVPTGAPEAKPVSKDDVRAFRAQHGLGSDPVILTVARLQPHKGVDRVIRALPSLPEATRYLVVGDGPARGDLEALARSLSVDGRVRFAGGITDAEIPLAYASADVFALLSRSLDGGRGGVEGCPVSLLEASAYGLPIVAGRTGGIADAITDGETSLLVDPESMGEVIRAFSSVLTQPEAAERLGTTAKVRAETERSWAGVVERIEGILTGIAREART